MNLFRKLVLCFITYGKAVSLIIRTILMLHIESSSHSSFYGKAYLFLNISSS